MSSLSDDQKVDVVLKLYDHTQAEITRYRDIEWKITGWVVAVLAGIITLVKVKVFPAAGQPILQTILSIVSLVVAAYGIWHIHYVHDSLTKNRKLRRQIEDELELTRKLEDWKFLEKKEVSYWEGKGHLFSWWGLIVLVALYAVVALWLQQ
jgi:hypothetical protein